MESSSPSVPFPLLQAPVESTYRACTIPYRFPSDNPRKATPVEIQWIDLFLNSVPSFKQRAENDPTVPDAPAKAEKFAQRYTSMLEELKKNPESHGGPPDCILLCRLRELVLRELGFRDIFKKVKDEENAKAMSLFEGVIKRNDEIEDDGKRIENLVRGILAGNIFDLGSAQLAEVFAKDGMSFLASCQNLVSRPWVIDDLDAFKSKWTKKSWEKVAAAFLNLSACHLRRCCTVGALCCPPDVASAPAPCVRLTVHDISPGLESQLVLELESGEACPEILKILPGRRRHWFTVPLYQNLPNAASQATRQDTGRCGHHCAVECGR
ncbi:pantothenate kinase 4 isoform X1 [Zea mays]|uniref:pantothenate kinase 4 isoform X1 n=1 Tax=Zea mays TaxID=4577 RepID=UPI0009A99228|nr:pantothenate kinase 4 isoform X1 [Zea mays]|eukprot:XP_020399257.1 pantothenate kinase 4 isoform X1 [Zea mays]